MEVGKFALLQKLHGELPERVDGEEGDVLIRVAANLMPGNELRYQFHTTGNRGQTSWQISLNYDDIVETV